MKMTWACVGLLWGGRPSCAAHAWSRSCQAPPHQAVAGALCADVRASGRRTDAERHEPELCTPAIAGGAQALGRASGAIAAGNWADLVALDPEAPDLWGRAGDGILDAWIFAGDNAMVADVWSAGRHVITGGRHAAEGPIGAAYRAVMARLIGA